MKNILILEDDPLLAKTLVDGLTSMRAKAKAVNTLEKFYKALEKDKVDLCIMDRIVGAEDSLEAVGYVSDALPQAKILLLTRKTAVLDRIRGLEEGADDYVCKPFSLAELRLRVRLLLASPGVITRRKAIRLGSFVFYPDQGTLIAPDQKIYFRKREAELFLYLLQSEGALVDKKSLEKLLWPNSYDHNESTVDVYMRRIRQKLGPYQTLLETRRGFGYRLTVSPGRKNRRHRRASMQS